MMLEIKASAVCCLHLAPILLCGVISSVQSYLHLFGKEEGV